MSVPGLTGTWQQRNKQLYEKLGSPQGKYTGSYNQNIWLLDQIKKGNYGQPAPAQSPAQPVASAGTTAGTRAAEGAPVASFDTILSRDQYADPNLVQSGIDTRTAQYFNPLVQEARTGIEGDFANRGLSRSGARNTGVLSSYSDFLDQERSMQEQLLAARQAEIQQGYDLERKKYEENPTGYTKSTTEYKPYEKQEPEQSPYRYAQSYRDWVKDRYKV